MWLAEEMSESHPLFNKVQYVTTQSCERNEAEINYKSINRKYIEFDLRDKGMMVLVGMTLKPFGFFQHLQDYCMGSKYRPLRVWSETELANRGEAHLRKLYLKHPEKFFQVEFENAKSTRMRLVKCNFIISEMSNLKRVALNDKEQNPEMMKMLRSKIMEEERKLSFNNDLKEAFSPEKETTQKMIGVQE